MTLTNASVGAQLTSSILSAGTIGSAVSWTSSMGSLSVMRVGPHQPKCSAGSLLVNGVAVTNPAGNSFEYANSATFTNWTRSVPSGHRKVSFGFCITFPSPAPNNLFDIQVIYDLQGHYVAFQQRNGNQINLESDVGGKTTHSNQFITAPAGGTLWCSVLDDEAGGTAQMACFDPQTLAQVGSTVTVAQQTGRDVSSFRLGNNEIGSSSGKTEIEYLMTDYNGQFPLLPTLSGVVKPAPPTNLTVLIASRLESNSKIGLFFLVDEDRRRKKYNNRHNEKDRMYGVVDTYSVFVGKAKCVYKD